MSEGERNGNVTVARSDKANEPAEAAGSVRRVLVVDDSRAQVTLTSNILRRWGYDVVSAMTGADALALIDEGGIDLVLSDWVMPEMSGLELCEKIRARPGDDYVYIILLTSKSARADVAEGLAAGADDFLSKPISSQELRARISAGERLVETQQALAERNGQLAGALEELQKVYDALAKDLNEARRLQMSLVPDRMLSWPGADASLLLRPSGHVGGDLVGSFAISDTRIGIYSIDVSGHGVASALMTARLAGYLSGHSSDRNMALMEDGAGGFTIRPLPEICDRLNATMLADMETELYFTMAMADCDLETGRARVVQAGHPHPLIERKDGAVEYIGAGGMPIGLFDFAEYADFEVQLQPGDRLFLYSDGVSEAESEAGVMLDQSGLERLLGEIGSARGEDFLEVLVWKLSEYVGRNEFDDDVSGVLLEYSGSGEA